MCQLLSLQDKYNISYPQENYSTEVKKNQENK